MSRRTAISRLYAWLLSFLLLTARFTQAQLDLGLGGGGGGTIGIGGGGGGALGIGLGGLIDANGALTVTAGGVLDVAASLTTLTLGGGDVQIQSSCSCQDMEWNQGNIDMSAGGSLELTGASNAYACSSCGAPLAMSGGSFSCTNGGSLTLQQGAQTTIQNTQINGAYLQGSASSQLSLQNCQVSQPMSCYGTADSQTKVEAGATVCNAQCLFSAPCQVAAGGELRATDSGRVQIDDNQELQVTGGTLSCAGGCSNNNIQVGSYTGAGGTLAFRGSAPSSCAAGTINLQSQSELIVAAEATKQVTAPTTITGTGSAQVAGQINIPSTYTCQHAQTQLTGTVQVQSAGQLVVAGSHTFQAQGGAQLQCSYCQGQESHVVGCDSCGERAEIQVAPGPAPAPVVCSGGSYGLRASGSVHVVENAHLQVQSATEFHGQGALQVERAAVHEVAHVHTCNHAQTNIAEQATLRVSGSTGQYVCGSGHTLQLRGSTVEHVNVQAQDTIRVKAGGAVRCAPASGPAVIKEGAKINIEENAEVRVKSNAHLQIAGPCTTYGAGAHIVESAAIHECADVHTAAHVSTQINEQAKLRISGAAGQYVCAPGHTLQLQGSTVEHVNVQAQDTIRVQAGGAVRCAPASGPAVIKEGAKINIEQNAEIRTQSNAHLQIAGPCTTYGAGAHVVESAAIHECADVHTAAHASTQINEQAKLRISGAAGQYVCAPGHTLQLQGSTVEHVNVQAQDTIRVQAGGAMRCAPASGPAVIKEGAKINIEENAEVRTQSNAQLQIAGPCTTYGGGAHVVESAAIHECADVHTAAHVSTQINEQAKLRISGATGQYNCAAGHTLNLKGATVEHVNVQAQDTLRVQAGAAVHAVASATPTSFGAGGQVNIEESAKLHVDTGAKLQIAGPCTTRGAGQVLVQGELSCQAAHTSSAPVVVASGGAHTLNCAEQHSYSQLSYQDGAACNIVAGSQGIKPVQVSGQAQLSGSLNIRAAASGYAPAGPVTLMQAGSVQGSFQSCASDSATVKGAVQVTANAVVWYPNASQCSGGCMPVA